MKTFKPACIFCDCMRTFILGVSVLCLIIFFQVFVQQRAFAAATPTGQLFQPIGSGTPLGNGDYVSNSTRLNTYYSYFIEVPQGIGQLRADIFDADIGAGPNHDFQLGTSYNTSVRYSLINPSGVTVRTATIGPGGYPVCDNTWCGWSITNPAAGHWELRVDMSTAVTTGDDVNAYGIRAHDGNSGSGGTELNIYAESFVGVGFIGSGPITHQLHPYITSGCEADCNDFDWDNDGSNSFTSRTGAFSQTTGVSGATTWLNSVLSNWTTDESSDDYGIWNANLSLNLFPTGSGNVGTFYMGNYAAATPSGSGPPPSSQPEANTFRIYLPTDPSTPGGVGSAPVKPYLAQTFTHISGPNPPQVNDTTTVQIDVTISNPTPYGITFSAANVITAYVPGSGAVYGGGATVTQGSITGQPSIGGTGAVTWNPGTVAAGTTATLSYLVNATPTSSGQRIPLTGIPGSNGTTATYVDETGNTTQSRATFTYGPICELALTEGVGLPTLAVISSFNGYEKEGKTVVEWVTSSEIGTVGFFLKRLDEEKDRYVRVNKELLPGLLHSSQGGTYRVIDDGALPGKTYTYKLVEVEAKGKKRKYGPFTVTVGGRGFGEEDTDSSKEEKQLSFPGLVPGHSIHFTPLPFSRSQDSSQEAMDGDFSNKAHEMSDTKKARIKARRLAKKKAKLIGEERIGNRAKIAVVEKGLYYVDATEIADILGVPLRRIKRWIKGNRLDLRNRGEEVAYIPAGDLSGIYFYADAVDSIYTKENIYWLEKGKGLPMMVMEANGPVLETSTGDGTFAHTLHVEEDHWPLTAIFDNPHSDYWLWDYIISGHADLGSKIFPFNADGVAGIDSATLSVHLKGATETEAEKDHHVVVGLNGVEIGEGSWDGMAAYELIISLDASLLNDGENTIEVTGLLDSGAPYSIFYLDSFDLTYERTYQAVDNRLLCRGDGNEVVKVKGFTCQDIYVFDVTNAKRPKLIKTGSVYQTDNGYGTNFRPADPDALYLVLTLDASIDPLSVTADKPSQLKEKKNGAEYLVITPSELKEAAQALADYRQGQGLESMVVDLEDIYDEFNHGISSPEAIRDFIFFAYNNWSGAPRYVVLAGDGTFDYKDNMGHGDNLVPPLMVSTPYGLFASDNRFVDVEGDDGVPEMAIGRLPVMTSEELEAAIDKIAAYEKEGGEWAGNVLMVADNPDDGGDFTAGSDYLATLLPPDYTLEKIYLPDETLDDARAMLFDCLDEGALILNYIGHGGMDRLAQEGLLLTSDVTSLENGEHLPVITALSCVIGRFALPGFDSLGEELVLHDRGGAIALWAATGLSENDQAIILDEAFFKALFEDGEKVLGWAINKALKSYSEQGGEPFMLDIYSLLGDPALEMRKGKTRKGRRAPGSTLKTDFSSIGAESKKETLRVPGF